MSPGVRAISTLVTKARRYGIAIAAIAVVVGASWCWLRSRDVPGGAMESRDTNVDPTSQRAASADRAGLQFGRQRDFRRVAGVVLFDGSPVRGATVRLVSKPTTAGLIAEPHVVTDPSGQFDFGLQPPAAYLVVAEVPRLTGALLSLDLRDPLATPPPDQLRLVMHACDASIYGTVRDSAGGVVPKARVSWNEYLMTASVGTDAGEDGSYELCIPIPGAALLIRAAGYAQILDQVTAYGRLRRDFLLSPEAPLHGRVVRVVDHTPVPGAIVELSPDDPRLNHPVLYAASDADGHFHFEGAAPGRHVVTATAERLATARPIHVIADVAVPDEEVVCALSPTLRIAGKVVEAQSATPLGGLNVSMNPRGGFVRDHELESVTQSDGSFEIRDALPGEFQPFVKNEQLSNRHPTVVKLTNADVDGVVIEVERLATISGRVTRGGKPVDGARVSAHGAGDETTTDHEGHYTLRGVRAGTVTMYAESQRIGAFTNGPTITVTKGEKKTGVDLDLGLAASISGTVVDQTSAPVSGVVVRFSLLHGTDYGVATTADDGTFTARALAGGGDYIYEVYQNEGSAPFRRLDGRRFTSVAVHDSQSHITGIRIKIRRERLTIAGRVVDAAGKPVPDVTIAAAPNEMYVPASSTTDGSGAFLIRDLVAGSYDLRVTAARAEQVEKNVAAGRTDLVIRLSQVGSIEGTLDGFADVPEVVASLEDGPWSLHYATSTERSFRLRDIPVGVYGVFATSLSGTARATVTVPAGGVGKVSLHARGFGAIAGTIVDASTHVPLADMECRCVSGEGGCMDGPVASDATGSYRIDRASPGETEVICMGKGAFAMSQVNVIAGQTVHVDLAASARSPIRHGHAGLAFEDQFGLAMVASVEPGGPADRAGIAVGDVLLKIDDKASDSGDGRGALWMLEQHPAGTSVRLTVERGESQLVLNLTIEAAP
jgi:protocatechuate 3,4-dioxygenase beta subunit